MALDRRYLKKHGQQWLVVVKVPARLRPMVGKAHLKHPLKTDSLALANRDKHQHVADMKARLVEAERSLKLRSGQAADPLDAEALGWRGHVEAARENPTMHPVGDDYAEDAHSRVLGELADRAEEIERSEGLARAKVFHEVAMGKATPILSLVGGWLAEQTMKARQQTDYRRAVLKFERWLAVLKLPTVAEACTRRVAGRYVTEQFARTATHARTANKDISCLSSFWRWLEKKGYVTENIWVRQALPERTTAKGEAKRPYTDAEIITLLTGNPSELLHDTMMIAALSGMRVEEIARLAVSDVADRCFDIKQAKSPAGVRMVPIHPALADIIDRRLNDKPPSAPLFPELPIPKPGSPVERSQKVVKQFTKYRRKCRVDDVAPGARQSRVDFHSFRRWFITKAEQAGHSPHLIEAVVGHKRQGQSMGRYSAGPSDEQSRACVEAVMLPPLRPNT